MNLSNINAVGLTNYSNKPLLKIKDMVINTPYVLVNIKSVSTPFGRSIMVETDDNVIFLPQRLAHELNEEQVTQLNMMKLSLVFRGMSASGKANPASLVEFVPV